MIFDLTDLPQIRGASTLGHVGKYFDEARLREVEMGWTESAWLRLERKKNTHLAGEEGCYCCMR